MRIKEGKSVFNLRFLISGGAGGLFTGAMPAGTKTLAGVVGGRRGGRGGIERVPAVEDFETDFMDAVEEDSLSVSSESTGDAPDASSAGVRGELPVLSVRIVLVVKSTKDCSESERKMTESATIAGVLWVSGADASVAIVRGACRDFSVPRADIAPPRAAIERLGGYDRKSLAREDRGAPKSGPLPFPCRG